MMLPTHYYDRPHVFPHAIPCPGGGRGGGPGGGPGGGSGGGGGLYGLRVLGTGGTFRPPGGHDGLSGAPHFSGGLGAGGGSNLSGGSKKGIGSRSDRSEVVPDARIGEREKQLEDELSEIRIFLRTLQQDYTEKTKEADAHQQKANILELQIDGLEKQLSQYQAEIGTISE